jgi:co-chaperonin GroES (HSP10)
LAKRIRFVPPSGKIAVTPLNGEKLTESGLWLPGGQRATFGEVLAVYAPFRFPDEEEETHPFYRVGDKVIFGTHSGVEVQYEKTKAIILKENEILTKVVEEEDATNE